MQAVEISRVPSPRQLAGRRSLLAERAVALAAAGIVTLGAGPIAAVAASASGHNARHQARHAAHRTKTAIPQHNGGDRDADNNGGPSDGDGNL
jgi:hypothetical protein